MFGLSRVSQQNYLYNNTGKMYACGGWGTPNSARNDVQTYNLTTGAVAAGTVMTRAEWTGSAFSNQILGFQCGGYSGSAPINTAVYLRFADDTNNSWTWTSTTMPGTQRNVRGTSSANKGFSWGGHRDGTGSLSVNFQFEYATTAWRTGTALPFTGSPVSSGYPYIHSVPDQALWIGGMSDSGTHRKQRLIYTFATDATSYTETGAANFGSLGAACGDTTNMVALSGYQTSSTPTLTTAVNKYKVSDGTATSGTAVGTAWSHGDAAGSNFVGISAGTNTGGSATPAQMEGAYTYSTDTWTLLNAYLANNNIYSVKRENTACFSSAQTD